MANKKVNGDRYAYASIDTAPGEGGYWSDAVSMSNKNTKSLFFSYRGGGVGTVTIQFKCPEDDDWTDLTTDQTIEDGVRFIVEDFASGVKYRAGLKEDVNSSAANDTYTSGTIICGFDW